MHPLSHRKQFEMMNRDVAQLVSAPALGAGGPPFESEYPDDQKEKHLQQQVLFLCTKVPFGAQNKKRRMAVSHPSLYVGVWITIQDPSKF